MSTRTERQANKAQNEENIRKLTELVKRPENKTCADCKAKDPRWASHNLGVFLCMRCAGVHRSLGTHISKMKSVDLDTWLPEQVATMEAWGNAKANMYWEASMTGSHEPTGNLEFWIRQKYESKRWAAPGAIPDPATLIGARPHAPVSASASPAPSAATSPARPAVTALPAPASFASFPAPPAVTAATAVAQPTPKNELFQAFAAPAPVTTAPSTQMSFKTDIMSLYQQPAQTRAQPANAGWGAFQTISPTAATGVQGLGAFPNPAAGPATNGFFPQTFPAQPPLPTQQPGAFAAQAFSGFPAAGSTAPTAGFGAFGAPTQQFAAQPVQAFDAQQAGGWAAFGSSQGVQATQVPAAGGFGGMNGVGVTGMPAFQPPVQQGGFPSMQWGKN